MVKMMQSDIIEKVRRALDKYESRLSEINQKVSYHALAQNTTHAYNDILRMSEYRFGPIQN